MKPHIEHIRSLLFEKISGTISEADDRLVTEAIQNDEEIRQLWEEIRHAFNKPEAKHFLLSRDEEASWKNLAGQLRSQDPCLPLYLRPRTWVAAAVVTGVCLLGVYFYSRVSSTKTGLPPAIVAKAPSSLQLTLADGTTIDLSDTAARKIKAGKIQVAATEKALTYAASEDSVLQWASLYVPNKLDYKVSLPDGTQVWLNASSTLRFPYTFSGSSREVYLEGEGYFNVAKNAAKPFIVHAGATSVKVLGTSFNVNAYEASRPVTSLVEGSVMAYAGDVSLTLQPGYQASYEGQQFSSSTFDSTDVLSWMSGISYFNRAPLSSISSILSRWFDVKVVFDNPDIAHQVFSGAIYKGKPLQVFLTNISISSGIQSYFNKDGTLHLK